MSDVIVDTDGRKPSADVLTSAHRGWLAGWVLSPVAVCAAFLLCGLGVLSAGIVVPPVGETAYPEASRQHVAFLLYVTGLSSWLPLCGLLCLRSYARRGWNAAIPVIGGSALSASLLVGWHAWQSCAAHGFGGLGRW